MPKSRAAQQAADHKDRQDRMAAFMESERVKSEIFLREFRSWVAKHDKGDGLYAGADSPDDVR